MHGFAQQNKDAEQEEPYAHSQPQMQLWRAHTDAASVRVLSARGRPSRGAGETGVRTRLRVRILMLLPEVSWSILILTAAQKRVDRQELTNEDPEST